MSDYESPLVTASEAPGAPGLPPNWCNGRKQAVGTTLGPARVWFTIGDGILNEIYYPRIDIPQVRDLGFIVTDNAGFWIEVKLIDDCRIEAVEAGIPAYTIVHRHPRFTLIQRIVPEPNRDVILIDLALQGDPTLRPCVLLAPRVGGSGREDMAEVSHYRTRRVLYSYQGPFGIALAAVDEAQADAFGDCSVGYSGISDAWQDFNRNGRFQWRYDKAGPGNIALSGMLPRRSVLALGFGSSREAAATLALSSLFQPFELIWQQQIDHWRDWHTRCRLPAPAPGQAALSPHVAAVIKTSAQVLRTHHDQTFRGALIASLSVPWGEYGEERPGYHLVWPRDLVECAGALLALGCDVEAREILRYLMATQREDGSWYQNQWLGGKPYWTGIQLDQVAFPVLLAGALADRGELDGIAASDMIRRALAFIVAHGPVSPQDRWEESSGVNTFTLAVCIAALVSGSRFLDTASEAFVLEIADFWNARLERWTAVGGTAFARDHGVAGYYLRITPLAALSDQSALQRILPVKNRRDDRGVPLEEQIGVDFLQLVRYGLRLPNAPLIRDTLQLIDQLLRAELPQGPCWYRYSGDGYGEHADGGPYDGTGRGRPWPLLCGERGHYEVIAGGDARALLDTMAQLATDTHMLPEQVWDALPLPAAKLRPGGATGSACPLAWAHAEFIKLACSILENKPVDRPDPVWARYQGRIPNASVWFWTPGMPLDALPAGKAPAICLLEPTIVEWRYDNQLLRTTATTPLVSLGLHWAQLAPSGRSDKVLQLRWQESGQGRKSVMIAISRS